MNKAVLTIAALSIATTTLAAKPGWDDEDWGDDEPKGPTITGFAEWAVGNRLQGDSARPESNTLKEWRGRIQLDHESKGYTYRLKSDGVVDSVLNTASFELREAFVSTTINDNWDIRVGRQPITWGTGDLVFLNDLFPKDYESFFNGRDDEFLKAPSDAIRLTGYFDSANIDIAWLPYQQPDVFLTGERFSYYSPFVNDIVAAPPKLDPYKEDWDLSQSELALRIFGNWKKLEWAFYGYKGYTGQPLALTDSFRPTFAELTALGASVRTELFGGVAWAETAYHQTEDTSGDDFALPNPQARYLIGYETEAATNLTISGQWYIEQTLKYNELIDNSPNAAIEKDEFHQLITLRLHYRMLQEKLQFGAFVFYSPDAKDHYLRGNVSYRLSDEWLITTGINVFDGKDTHTQFSQLSNNSNAYLRLRWIH